ncbi:MAG TPA: GFA family protein [Acetobacteraceae bacterium]|nr:GFA family protein [Acetobacteraceae bacterium]
MGLRGGCLCGAVGYEVAQLDGPVVHCHCRTCRKAHASPYGASARVARGHFAWTRGQDRLTAYESTPGKKRWFCSACGTHLVAEWVTEPELILRAATLDDDPGVRPVLHMWVSHDAPWVTPPEGVPRYAEGSPEP